jgi:uncharacterized protein YbbC (DUF1343 family)
VPCALYAACFSFQGEECGGVNIIVADRAQMQPVYVGLEIAATLRRLYPDAWKIADYGRLLANAATLARYDKVNRRRRSCADGINISKSFGARVLGRCFTNDSSNGNLR